MSHYDWRDDEHMLFTAVPADRKEDVYEHVLIQDKTSRMEILGEGVLENHPGHCLYSPDRRWFLTDTYPEEDGRRRLILFNVEQNRKVELASQAKDAHQELLLIV